MVMQIGADMNDPQIQSHFREVEGFRLGLHSAAYVNSRLSVSPMASGFFVMGRDARTGRAVRREITASEVARLHAAARILPAVSLFDAG